VKISIKVNAIDKLNTRTKVVEEKDSEGDVVDRKIITSLNFEGSIPPVVMARILNLQRQNAPLYLVVGSDQAFMDLNFTREEGDKALREEIKADKEQAEFEMQAEADAVNQPVEWQEEQPEKVLVTQE
jgi:hypothetical protein